MGCQNGDAPRFNLSLAPGFSPVQAVLDDESCFNSFHPRPDKPLKRLRLLSTVLSTRLKPGANERHPSATPTDPIPGSASGWMSVDGAGQHAPHAARGARLCRRPAAAGCGGLIPRFMAGCGWSSGPSRAPVGFGLEEESRCLDSPANSKWGIEAQADTVQAWLRSS
jgi:hypothetical protein